MSRLLFAYTISVLQKGGGFFMKRLKIFTAVGGAAVLVLGTAAHFFYEWSGENFLIGMIAPVNESTWEHMKLAFFPMLLFAAAAQIFLGKAYPGAASAALCAALLSTVLIPVLFYTYVGVLGFTVPVLNILTFVAAVLIGVLVFFHLCKSGSAERFLPLLFAAAAAAALAFFLFPCFPPEVGLFAQP